MSFLAGTDLVEEAEQPAKGVLYAHRRVTAPALQAQSATVKRLPCSCGLAEIVSMLGHVHGRVAGPVALTGFDRNRSYTQG